MLKARRTITVWYREEKSTGYEMEKKLQFDSK
jgi:hypothetical protein